MAAIKTTLAIHGNTTTVPHALNFTRATSATRVNPLGLVETVAAGEIRLDYNPSVAGELYGWLLEESSTNSCLQSENFSNASWAEAGDGNITANTAKAPDGLNTADSLTAEVGGDNRVAVTQAGLNFTSGNKYTVSVWAKKPTANGVDYLEISDKLDANGVTYSKVFKLSDGTLGESGGSVVDATITGYPNRWYRCTVTFTAGAGMTTLYLKARSDDETSSTSTVNVSSGICLWGIQIEEKEYATSYIATTTAAVTRNADVAYIEETNPCWNWDVGTSLAISATPLYTGGSNKPIYHYQDETNRNFVTLLNTGNVKIFSDADNPGTSANQLDADPFITGFTTTAKSQFKNMLALKKDSAHMAQNGALSTTLAADNSITVPLNTTAQTYSIKFFHGTGLNQGSGWLRYFLLWSHVVSDDVLKSDTLMGTGLGTAQIDLYNQIADLTITTAKLAPDAVTGDKIADNSIGTEHLKLDIIVAEDIASNAITVAELRNDAVETAKIKDGAVTGPKIGMGLDAAGDMMYHNGTSYVRLPKGTNGHLLTLDTGLPTWAADPTNVTGTALGGELSGTVGAATIVNGAVTNAKLGADAVDDTKIADDAIKSEHYTDLSILNAHIGDLQVTGGKIANDTITATQIKSHATLDANRAIGANHIKDGNVTRVKLAADVIDSSKLADDSVNSEHYVDGSIDTAHIADLQVTDVKLADNAVTTNKITNLNVTEDKIAVGAVTNAKLGPDAVDGAKIADDAINSEHYVDGSIDTAHIGDLQVTGGKIANNTITATQIANTTITSSQLAANAVDTAQIADNAVSGSKIELGSDAQGDIMYYDGTNYVRLAAGTSGQVLTTGGSGANPAWAADSTNVGNTAVGGDVTGTVSNITIPTGAITSAMLGVNVILAEDIANNAVTVAELATNAVETIKIKDLNVTTAKLADGAVTGPKIAMGSDARGDIMYHNGTSYVRLAKGTNGQVLKMGANDPAWGADIDTTIGDAAVGGNVSGTISNITISAGVVTPTMLSAGGTANNTTFLRGDGQWATPAITETDPTAVTMAIALG